MRPAVRALLLGGAAAAPAFTALAAPASRTWSGSDSDWTTVENPFTCTPSGGVAPYTYDWTVVSTTGNPDGLGLDGAHGATLTFLTDFLDETAPVVVLKCTVTDATAAVAVSNTVTVS